VTPLERAARDRLAAFLDALDPGVDTIVTLKRGDTLIPLKGGDLRVVLAALDRHDAEQRLREALRDRDPGQCGKVRPHPAHRWLPNRTALDCPGIPTPAQENAGERCLCYRDGHYVGLAGPCTCALRGVQDCPCLAPERQAETDV